MLNFEIQTTGKSKPPFQTAEINNTALNEQHTIFHEPKEWVNPDCSGAEFDQALLGGHPPALGYAIALAIKKGIPTEVPADR
jgi:hypothetical protein